MFLSSIASIFMDGSFRWRVRVDYLLDFTSARQMCYLPVKCLKAIVFIGSICAIVISIGLLALTIYVQVEKKEIISAANQGAVTGSLIVLYLSSILFLLLGVAGLSGSMKGMSRKENKGTCLIGLFSIGVMVFFLIFLAATIFFFVGPETIFGTDCTAGSKTTFVKDLYQTSKQAYGTFCTDNCPCLISDKTSELYTRVSTNGGITNDDPKIGKTKFGDCDPAPKSSLANIEFIAALENILQCGGWCPLVKDQPPFGGYTYRFRNINDCRSKDCLDNLVNCHDKFQEFMTGSGRIVGFGCMGAMLICFLNIIAVCCICFHPSKVKKGSNFYSRMIEID